MGFDFLDFGFPKTGTDWKSINGKPYITVSSKGRSNGLSTKINDGADFGPDTTLGASSPNQTGTPYSDTIGIEEACLYGIYNRKKVVLNSGYYKITRNTFKSVVSGAIDTNSGTPNTVYYLIGIPAAPSTEQNISYTLDIEGAVGSPANIGNYWIPTVEQAPVVIDLTGVTPISGAVRQYMFALNSTAYDNYNTIVMKNITFISPDGSIGALFHSNGLGFDIENVNVVGTGSPPSVGNSYTAAFAVDAGFGGDESWMTNVSIFNMYAGIDFLHSHFNGGSIAIQASVVPVLISQVWSHINHINHLSLGGNVYGFYVATTQTNMVSQLVIDVLGDEIHSMFVSHVIDPNNVLGLTVVNSVIFNTNTSTWTPLLVTSGGANIHVMHNGYTSPSENLGYFSTSSANNLNTYSTASTSPIFIGYGIQLYQGEKGFLYKSGSNYQNSIIAKVLALFTVSNNTASDGVQVTLYRSVYGSGTPTPGSPPNTGDSPIYSVTLTSNTANEVINGMLTFLDSSWEGTSYNYPPLIQYYLTINAVGGGTATIYGNNGQALFEVQGVSRNSTMLI